MPLIKGVVLDFEIDQNLAETIRDTVPYAFNNLEKAVLTMTEEGARTLIQNFALINYPMLIDMAAMRHLTHLEMRAPPLGYNVRRITLLAVEACLVQFRQLKVIRLNWDNRNEGNQFSSVAMFDRGDDDVPELVLLNLQVDQGHGLVSNILPLLATQTPCLKELNIGIKIENATSVQLLRALQACPLLEIFKVAGESMSLVDPAVFAHLALVARLSEFELGAEIGHLLLEPTIASLPAHRTIFDHLATAYLHVNPSAAKLLFPRMKATEAISLRISEPSDILTWVAEMPRLVTLELQCMRSMPLDRHVLAGLQNMNLQRFKINAAAGAAIDGSEIQADQLDYLFGNHLTLSELTFAWQGSSSSAHIMSFLQYSPHLVLEKIARFYPHVRELTLVAPCAAIDFLRTPDIPLNMNLRFLTIERIAQPAQPPQNTNYNRDVHIIAEKIDYHFPNLSGLESVNDQDFTKFVFRDVRRIKKMRRDMARLGGEYLYMFPRYVLYR
ncbi:hypothetical protein D6D20_10396 [Aureobasidium pullulans]|uniref:F-box domain-containing protein n=1 Tax=Aureobasidium pullulans TaxID=5580 RepID=A0A4V4ILF1_AURPU|nr:hypothetical protein D6D20_10396 [Aureobasidium pullulans]